jgi:Reverse transcriptase (RNA-dependent DNA polymerase)
VLAVLEDWEILQMDIKLAFLNGLLDKEICKEQLQGFIMADQLDTVCLLNKALHSLLCT